MSTVDATCLGVLILGVCVPVPGEPRAEAESRGWAETCGTVMRGPDGTGWEGNLNPPTWRKRVGGSLAGTQGKVDSVFLLSFDGTDVIQRSLQPYCRGSGDRWTCSAAGQSFVAERCRKMFWRFVPARATDGGTVDWCGQYAPLFESLLRTEKPTHDGGTVR
jgi:hypothetical protein